MPAADENSFEKLFNICEQYENAYIMLGVHPSEAKSFTNETIEKIKKLSSHKKVIGVGEIGLDYYWDKSFSDLQKEIFIKQIELANELDFPIAIHDREAHQDTFEILQKHNKNSQVIMHCYSGSLEFARECVNAGYYLGIGGVVTFKNAKKMKDVVREIPLDKLVLETDSPFLTPVPYRGETNKPAYVKFVAQEIANIKNIQYNEVAETTSKTAEKVLKI